MLAVIFIIFFDITVIVGLLGLVRTRFDQTSRCWST
jgi:hypothetical protein